MDQLDKHKKRFLDGEITASEYEKIVSNLEKEKKSKEASISNNVVTDTTEDKSYQWKIAVFIVLASAVIYVIGIPKPTVSDNVEIYNDATPAEIKRQKAVEDSIYKIESEKREKLELAEEAAFRKTKAGKIYKKHPEWSKEECKMLAEGSIWIGMDIKMLKYKRGLPNSANPSNYGGGVTQWQWCWTDWTPSCFYDNDGDGKIDSYN